MKKIVFLAGLAVGVVIGSRLGRGPYDSLERTARQVAQDPEVQRRAAAARDAAGRAAHDAATGARSAVAEAASAAKHRLATGADDEELLGLLDEEDATGGSENSEGAQSAATSGGDAEVGDEKPLSS